MTSPLPDLLSLLRELAENAVAWSNSLELKAYRYDSQLEEGGSNDWGRRLDEAVGKIAKKIVSILTVSGRRDLGLDLAQRYESLLEQAHGYQRRLETLEDQRRAQVAGLVTQYNRKFNDDHDHSRLHHLCQGVQRVWTLRDGQNLLERVDDFAEAIDKASWHEQDVKLKARAETQGAALDFAEHIEILIAATESTTTRQEDHTRKAPSRRGKRGPVRMPLSEAWRYLTIVQEWASAQQRNRKLPQRDRIRKVQVAHKHDITVKELDAMLGWYAKHQREERFPDDPRTLSRGELQKWFE